MYQLRIEDSRGEDVTSDKVADVTYDTPQEASEGAREVQATLPRGRRAIPYQPKARKR